MNSRHITPVTALFFALACSPSAEDVANGADPIAALASTAESSRYGLNYWIEQRDQKSETWAQAVAYCEPAERANYPNCETVRQVRATVPKPVQDPRTQPGFGEF